MWIFQLIGLIFILVVINHLWDTRGRKQRIKNLRQEIEFYKTHPEARKRAIESMDSLND